VPSSTLLSIVSSS